MVPLSAAASPAVVPPPVFAEPRWEFGCIQDHRYVNGSLELDTYWSNGDATWETIASFEDDYKAMKTVDKYVADRRTQICLNTPVSPAYASPCKLTAGALVG